MRRQAGVRAKMGSMDAVMPYVLALVPTIGVATLFYFVMKTILEGDRRERIAQAKWEAEHDLEANRAKASSDPTVGPEANHRQP